MHARDARGTVQLLQFGGRLLQAGAAAEGLRNCCQSRAPLHCVCSDPSIQTHIDENETILACIATLPCKKPCVPAAVISIPKG
jgi:hypothetical protein